MARKKNMHEGSSFSTFLREEGIEAEVQARGIRRMIALELGKTMRKEKLSKTALAKRLGTSRSRLNILLDPEDETNLRISTLAKAAEVIGKVLHFELRDA